MKFPNLPTFTVAEIEHKAGELLIGACENGIAIPIDVEWVLENMDGVVFDVWPGLSDNHNTVGMTCRDTETGDIGVFVDEKLADDS